MNHSAINAGMAQFIARAIAVDDWAALSVVPDGKQFEVFFLTTYCPQYAWIWAHYGASFDVPYVGVGEWRQAGIDRISGEYLGVSTIVPEVDDLDGGTYTTHPAQRVRGVTSTYKVPVYGFLYRDMVGLPAWGIGNQNGPMVDPATAHLFMNITGAGAGVRSEPWTVTSDAGDDPITMSIILPEEEYTQAILDSDNWVEGSWAVDQHLRGKVVGIYAEINR
jgi:hypothetical protein